MAGNELEWALDDLKAFWASHLGSQNGAAVEDKLQECDLEELVQLAAQFFESFIHSGGSNIIRERLDSIKSNFDDASHCIRGLGHRALDIFQQYIDALRNGPLRKKALPIMMVPGETTPESNAAMLSGPECLITSPLVLNLEKAMLDLGRAHPHPLLDEAIRAQELFRDEAWRLRRNRRRDHHEGVFLLLCCWLDMQSDFQTYSEHMQLIGELRNNGSMRGILGAARNLSFALERSRVEVSKATALSFVHSRQDSFFPTSDFRSVRCGNRFFVFSVTEADCVRVLWEYWEKGVLEVSQAVVLREAKSACVRLIDVFRTSDAWETLIVKGSKKGMYRLVIPPLPVRKVNRNG